MTSAPRWAILAAAACALACKGQAGSGTSAATSAVASAAASAPAAPPKPELPWYAGTWSGSYTASAGEPDTGPGALREWSKDDGKAAVGPGTLKLVIDEKGVASGDAEGALGAHSINGSADTEMLRLALAPKTATNELEAFRATAVIKRDGDVLRGTLHAGSGDGKTLRQASLELRRAAP